MTVLIGATENLCVSTSVDQVQPTAVDLVSGATLECDRDYTEGVPVGVEGDVIVDELGFAIIDELGEEINYE